MFRKILFSFLFLLGAVIIYYCAVIIKARLDTPEIVQEVLASDRIKLQLNDFSFRQMEILLKVQDPKFYEHKGVDMRTPGAGITTISQGLVKFYYFDHFEAGFKKIKQILIARFAFDAMVPKDTQLLLFINEVYLGHYNNSQVKGFENAAQTYFSKSFKELNEDEYIALVAMIRAPGGFHILEKPQEHQLRVMRVKNFLNGNYTPVDNADQFYDRY